MICCVRRASSAASSVGSASASSSALVCSDWQPPSTAASACDRRRDDIIFRLLRGQRRSRRLRVEAQHQRARISRAKAFAHDVRPEPARGAVLRDLLEQVVVRVEEKRKPRREFVHGQARGDRGVDVGDGVGQREGHFLRGGRASLANVIAGNGDGVPGGQFGAAPGEKIGDDAHRRARRIDVGAARDVFLQDIVLHRAGKFVRGPRPGVCATAA